MKTEFKEENNNYVMSFEGRFDATAAIQAEKSMKVLFESCGHDIILDCSKLVYISSSGLRLFLGLLKNSMAKGLRLRLVGLSDDLKRVFDTTGFSQIFYL